jgi:hypothetical protein
VSDDESVGPDAEPVDGADDAAEPERPERPEWDDPYLDGVAERLVFNYDLERDRRVNGERFELYGRLLIESRKQFIHQSVRYAHQSVHEHLLATRHDGVTVRELDRLADLGHRLADDWIDADEEHKSTDFTFVVVTDAIPDDVRERVDGFRDRTLIRYGYYGHYEVNLVVVAPEREAYVASDEADVWRAFAPWADEDPDPDSGLFGRIKGLLGR